MHQLSKYKVRARQTFFWLATFIENYLINIVFVNIRKDSALVCDIDFTLSCVILDC